MDPSMVMLNPQPLPPNEVVVSVAGDALFNLDKFFEIQKSILGRLGCGGCTSGYDISWKHLNRFHIDEKLNVVDVPGQVFGR
jgi:hypothetical protein